MSADRGSVTVIAAALVAVMLVLTVVVAGSGVALAARFQASTAADAAALAAAPVTFRSYGARGSPGSEARRFAAANGARLLRCDCPVDRSWRRRVVTTVVEVRANIPGLGERAIRAVGRAAFDPALLLPKPARSGFEDGA